MLLFNIPKKLKEFKKRLDNKKSHHFHKGNVYCSRCFIVIDNAKHYSCDEYEKLYAENLERKTLKEKEHRAELEAHRAKSICLRCVNEGIIRGNNIIERIDYSRFFCLKDMDNKVNGINVGRDIILECTYFESQVNDGIVKATPNKGERENRFLNQFNEES